jgi:XTP/dITP diphosphohydrolase
MKELVLATRNPHKLREMKEILAAAGLDVALRGLNEYPDTLEVIEDGETFEANALKKAESAARATGLVAVADDSGLEVDALGGAPGVLSARYAGPDGDHAANNAKLLRELAGVPDGERRARFVCVIAVAAAGREARVFRGASEGRITHGLRGKNGFGYDPLFFSDDLGKTFAEASASEKNSVSHRGRAVARLLEALAAGEFDGCP